ncbi:MAG: hypothetical protein QN178_08905 [Armatimonadota bacterium]|nr:hypothetical protein [Armatimonadota bacterium]
MLSVGLAILMATQAVLGLVFPDGYRDTGYVRATWCGNDWVTLVVGVPVLITGLLLERRDSVRGRLAWMGALGYGVYNYAFYLFGAALNVFLPLYVGTFLLALVPLILALSCTDAAGVAATFRSSTPVRLVGGYLIVVAAGLTAVWLGMWAAHVFAGRPTPVDPEAFKIVAALDLTVMVPALLTGGVLLRRKHPWGYVIAPIAAIQGALYLLVLSVNSVIFIVRGLAEVPGELPVWGILTTATSAAAMLLLMNTQERCRDG